MIMIMMIVIFMIMVFVCSHLFASSAEAISMFRARIPALLRRRRLRLPRGTWRLQPWEHQGVNLKCLQPHPLPMRWFSVDDHLEVLGEP